MKVAQALLVLISQWGDHVPARGLYRGQSGLDQVENQNAHRLPCSAGRAHSHSQFPVSFPPTSQAPVGQLGKPRVTTVRAEWWCQDGQSRELEVPWSCPAISGRPEGYLPGRASQTAMPSSNHCPPDRTPQVIPLSLLSGPPSANCPEGRKLCCSCSESKRQKTEKYSYSISLLI